MKLILNLMAIILVVSALQSHADIIVPSLEQIKTATTNEEHCNTYADTAIEQVKHSQKHSCGFTGKLWSTKREDHYQSCVKELKYLSTEDMELRNKNIDTCLTKKTSITNPANQVKLPAQCVIPHYHPIKSLYRYFRYERDIQFPVQNGLITYDYNQDRKPDYVFLEVKEKIATITICLSHNKGYKRQLTDLVFDIEGGSTSGGIDTVTQQGNQLSVNSSLFEHNIGSSGRTVLYRYNKAKQAFQITSNESSVNPVYYDGEPAPMSVPATPKLNVQRNEP